MDISGLQFHPGDDTKANGWVKILERYGPDVVRISLETNDKPPSGGVHIGPVEITKGFAQEWLTHKLAERSEAERTAKAQQLTWTRRATIAGGAAAIGTGLNALVGAYRLWTERTSASPPPKP